jgi:hypothetical protein
MKNNPFGDIQKKTKTANKSEFIESAKVDGASTLDKNERRGASYIDRDSGEKVKLTGKILQVPVNGYELRILENGAKKNGLPLSSYLRTLGIKDSSKIT